MARVNDAEKCKVYTTYLLPSMYVQKTEGFLTSILSFHDSNSLYFYGHLYCVYWLWLFVKNTVIP